jgi:shikimate kinase
MGPSKKCEYILVVVDYVSKWVEALPCKNADNISSKRMFEEIIFLRFRVPRIVISDGGSHFIDKRFKLYLSKHGILIMLLLLTTLRQVARQRHQTNQSRIFYKRQ